MRLALLACLVAVLLLPGVASAASSSPPPDSLAPAGAQHNWLPSQGWVFMHWLPFEENELASALRTDAAGIRAYLADDTHTLSTLAARQGWKPKPLARWLTRRWDHRVAPKRLRDLRYRAERMLTQGHLAQHVLFHSFHGPAIPANAPSLFGISSEEFVAARQTGLTPNQIAEQHGISPSDLRAGVLTLLTDEAARGVKTESTSRAESLRGLGRQEAALDCWLSSPLPKLDPRNPFGGRDGGAGQSPTGETAPQIPGCGGMAGMDCPDCPSS